MLHVSCNLFKHYCPIVVPFQKSNQPSKLSHIQIHSLQWWPHWREQLTESSDMNEHCVESIPLSIRQVMLKLSIRRAKSANKSIWNSNTWKGNGNKWNPWRINLPINLSDSQSTRNVKDVNPTTQPGFINLVWILWQKCFFVCSVLQILITDCSIQELTSGQLKRYY